MGLLKLLKLLLTHRIAYRFLIVLGTSLGLTSGVQHISELEAIVCLMVGGCN